MQADRYSRRESRNKRTLLINLTKPFLLVFLSLSEHWLTPPTWKWDLLSLEPRSNSVLDQMNFIWYTIHGVLLSHFIVIAIIKHAVPVNTRNATLGYINMMYNDSDSAKDREGGRVGKSMPCLLPSCQRYIYKSHGTG